MSAAITAALTGTVLNELLNRSTPQAEWHRAS